MKLREIGLLKSALLWRISIKRSLIGLLLDVAQIHILFGYTDHDDYMINGKAIESPTFSVLHEAKPTVELKAK